MKQSRVYLGREDLCAICGRPKQAVHHLIFGNGMRKEADDEGIFIPICNNCHNMAYFRPEQIHENTMAEKLSKITGQLAWERWDIAEQLAKATGEKTKDIVIDSEERFLAKFGRKYI